MYKYTSKHDLFTSQLYIYIHCRQWEFQLYVCWQPQQPVSSGVFSPGCQLVISACLSTSHLQQSNGGDFSTVTGRGISPRHSGGSYQLPASGALKGQDQKYSVVESSRLSTLHYSTVRCITVQCSTVQFSKVHYSSIQYIRAYICIIGQTVSQQGVATGRLHVSGHCNELQCIVYCTALL